MELLQLLKSLDFLYQEQRMDKYKQQYYFFMNLAVTQQDCETMQTLLVRYTRDLLYVDDRTQIVQLLQRAEHFMLLPENRQYHADYYLIKGHLYHYALNFDAAKAAYKCAISRATETNNFRVLGIAFNRVLANYSTSHSKAQMMLSTMSPILLAMDRQCEGTEPYRVILYHIELAIKQQQYAYANHIIEALMSVDYIKMHKHLPRFQLELCLLEMRICLEQQDYERFLVHVALWEQDELLQQDQLDLYYVMYQLAIDVATLKKDTALVLLYTDKREKLMSQALVQNDVLIENEQTIIATNYMPHMVAFDELRQQCEEQIEQQQLENYTLTMFHVLGEALTEHERQQIMIRLHESMMEAQAVIAMSTMLSAQKMLYVMRTTDIQTEQILKKYVHPVLRACRKLYEKRFYVIVAFVNSEQYMYARFEETLQHTYALVYYANYEHLGGVLQHA